MQRSFSGMRRVLFRCTRLQLLLSLALISLPRLSAQQAERGKKPSDPNASWVGNTSGPFYTGTADVVPGGSFYIEPFFFLYNTGGIYNLTLPMRAAYGLGHRMEGDITLTAADNREAYQAQRIPEFGDVLGQLKVELHKEKDRYHFWSAPSLGLAFDLNIPTGNRRGSRRNVAGGTQTTTGTWEEQLNLLAHKQFKPFQLYLEGSEIVQNPADVTGPYDYSNGIDSLATGEHAHVVNGNVLAASAAIEHVLVPRYGFGYLVEMNTERQFAHSLFWGKANAPGFSYLNLSPILEVTWPAKGRFPITWGGGFSMTTYRNNTPRQLTPLFTITLNGNLHGAR